MLGAMGFPAAHDRRPRGAWALRAGLSAALACAGGAQPSSPAQEPAAAALPLEAAITAEELRAIVGALSDDGFAGRATATPGAKLAAEFIASRLAALGVEPGGQGGTYFQTVPLERWRGVKPAELRIEGHDARLATAVEGIGFRVRGRASSSAALRVASAGEVAELAELASPDVAVFLDASRSDALAWLEQAGHPDGLGFGLVLLPGSAEEGKAARAPSPQGRLTLRAAGASAPVCLLANGALLTELRAGRVRSVEFVSGHEREEVLCQNVIGRLPGDLELGAIVLSAHYDHLGVIAADPEPAAPAAPGDGAAAGDAEPVDRVYNGADDDASGCAALLELAGALAAEPRERPILFLFATGEELGLLGTEHYLAQPVVQLEDTLINLNFEMIGRPDALVGGPGFLWLTGWERTSLGPALSSAGCTIAPDPRPEQNFFSRSDNYAFARRGVVAQTLSSYDLHADYHSVDDEADTLDYAHMRAAVETARVALGVLDRGDFTVHWLPGQDPSTP